MRIDGFEVVTIEIPMRMSVEHALAKRSVARNVLVRATAGELSGWGECCPREYVTGESVEGVRDELRESILPSLLGTSVATLDEAAGALTPRLDVLARDGQAAFCAAELAVLDLAGKAEGKSVGDAIGPITADEVRYSGVIASADPERAREQCALARKFGVTEVKVKVVSSLETNIELLTIAREVLGGEARLRLDANAAWDADEAIRQLEALAEFHLEGVEQPVSGDDIEGMKRVTAAKLVPVVADETLCSMDDAQMLVDGRGCDVFNIRVSKCGGLLNAVRIHRFGIEGGLRSQLGAQVGETGILSAAGRQFATRCGPIWCEGSYGKLLLEEDITEPDITVGPGGRAPALTSPGLGATPLDERVDARSTERFSVS